MSERSWSEETKKSGCSKALHPTTNHTHYLTFKTNNSMSFTAKWFTLKNKIPRISRCAIRANVRGPSDRCQITSRSPLRFFFRAKGASDVGATAPVWNRGRSTPRTPLEVRMHSGAGKRLQKLWKFSHTVRMCAYICTYWSNDVCLKKLCLSVFECDYCMEILNFTFDWYIFI